MTYHSLTGLLAIHEALWNCIGSEDLVPGHGAETEGQSEDSQSLGVTALNPSSLLAQIVRAEREMKGWERQK